MAAGWALGSLHSKPINSNELFLIDPGVTCSASLPQPGESEGMSWESFGCSGRDAQECDSILGLLWWERGRNLGIDVNNITCTLWSCPRRDRMCPSAGGTRQGLLEPPQSFPRWLMETQDQLGKQSWISPEAGQIQLLAGDAGKDRPGTAGEIIGRKMAISFSHGFQGYRVFWSVLTENNKKPCGSSIIKLSSTEL